MAVVEWGHSQRKEVQTVDQLDALLDDVALKARSEAMPQDVQVFYVAGDHCSEVRWRNTIQLDAARDAIRHFLRTGELSADVSWEEG